jgi:hypothetical protein
LLAELVMMGFEPGTEVSWRGKECWFWRHGVYAARTLFSIAKGFSFLDSKLHFGPFWDL